VLNDNGFNVGKGRRLLNVLTRSELADGRGVGKGEEEWAGEEPAKDEGRGGHCCWC
jgi:hypothetical protein